MEKVLIEKEMTIYAFIDIDSSFDNTSHISTARSLEDWNLHTLMIW